MMKEKICKECGKLLPLESFRKLLYVKMVIQMYVKSVQLRKDEIKLE